MRLGEWPLLGRVDVTAEALAAGAVYRPPGHRRDGGLRRLLRLRRPDQVFARCGHSPGRSALTAALISRSVPVAAADVRPPARRGQPSRARRRSLGRGVLARRLLAGSLDRAVDVAATLELRGYGLPGTAAEPADALPLRRALPCRRRHGSAGRDRREAPGGRFLPPTRRFDRDQPGEPDALRPAGRIGAGPAPPAASGEVCHRPPADRGQSSNRPAHRRLEAPDV